jgi:hypothetical protein
MCCTLRERTLVRHPGLVPGSTGRLAWRMWLYRWAWGGVDPGTGPG